jgi:hypothetical protein
MIPNFATVRVKAVICNLDINFSEEKKSRTKFQNFQKHTFPTSPVKARVQDVSPISKILPRKIFVIFVNSVLDSPAGALTLIRTSSLSAKDSKQFIFS